MDAPSSARALPKDQRQQREISSSLRNILRHISALPVVGRPLASFTVSSGIGRDRPPALIDRLHNEILLYIFEILVEDAHTPFRGSWSVEEPRIVNISLSPKQQAQTTRPELVLSAVCRRWRNLAVHDPLLWNHINFRNEPTPCVRSQTYLTRSQQAWIVAEARVGNAPSGTEAELVAYFNEAFTVLFPHVRRCRHLGLQAPSLTQLRYCLAQIMEGREAEAECLRSVEFGARQPAMWGVIMEFLFHDDALGEYWRHRGQWVTALTLRGVLLPWTWIEWYSNLTHLTLTFRNNIRSQMENSRMPSKLTFLQILSRCPELKELELTGFRFSDPMYPGTAFEDPLHFDKLTAMRFSGFDPEHLDWLLTEIEAPYLRFFFYRTERGSLADVRNFLLRYAGPGSTLKALWVKALPGEGIGSTSTQLHSTLSFLPELEDLTIQHNHFHNSEISALTPRIHAGGPAVQCPKLKVLRLIGASFNFRHIATMVKERRTSSELPPPPPGQHDHRTIKLQILQISGMQASMPFAQTSAKEMMRESVDNLLWDDLQPLSSSSDGRVSTFAPFGFSF
ncbi:hypothetical protein M407DRAFT_31041 [Tulasnella calospora MUT 4182]|uniref:Uncharacterized protein n=1 Tax=Tulasnella calospora MUT 4182 TaxID=1051891 RepID=A0A0C3PWF0_9AGAM|nr:hypothetical protein M407DRAFT_31041 [Tulasnella calospora MUT 4182]